MDRTCSTKRGAGTGATPPELGGVSIQAFEEHDDICIYFFAEALPSTRFLSLRACEGL